jgi:two-component system, OmpR family, sensor kinase
MLNSISYKLGGVSLLIFGLQILFLLFAMQLMFDQSHLSTVAIYIVATAISAASIFAFAVHILFTRHIYSMAKALEDFRRSNFSEPVLMQFSNAQGDEISRLGYSIEQMQRKISAQLQQSQLIESQRREIFANISHDLRTPLTSMRGYLETLLLKTGTIPAKQQRAYLEIALKQTVYLSKLINDLFELSKLESNATTAKLETFPLSELVQDVMRKFQLIADEKSVVIKTNHGQSAFSTHGDISLIERVLTNIIDNALRHCPPKAAISIMLSQKNGRVNVQISDTGCGIMPDKLPLIFDRQFQGNGISKGDHHTGAGFGLAITKRIIELHGGSIHANSQIDMGTSFIFDLPAGQRAG